MSLLKKKQKKKQQVNKEYVTHLPKGESVIWLQDSTKGWLRPKIVHRYLISDKAVYDNTKRLRLSSVDSVISMNQHRAGHAHRAGVSQRFYGYGRGAIGGGGAHYGQSWSKSKTVGDVLFIVNGKPLMTFRGLADPAGIVKLAKEVIKASNKKKL